MLLCASLMALFMTSCNPAHQGDTEIASGPPKVLHVGLVAPDIIGITLQCGRVVYGRQVPYIRQPGDTVQDVKDRWVFRQGRCIGALVGADQNILFTMDRLEGPAFSREWAKVENYRVTINRTGPVQPMALYRKSKPADMARTGPLEFKAPTEDVVYLKLTKPVPAGAQVTITCGGSTPWSCELKFDPNRTRSEAIHTTHIGFRPDDPGKVAFLSCWLGDGGPLKYEPLPRFSVVREKDGKVVLRGTVRLHKPLSEKDEDAYGNNHNGTDVYEMDLNGLSTPGTYRVVVEGIGCSYPLRVSADVWRKAFYISARGFYHQRSGIELGPPYTQFKRPRSFHPDDGVRVYHSTTGLMDTANGLANEPTNFGNLVKGATNELVPNAWGGYMDAGDWDRRIHHMDATRLLLELAMEFPEYFQKLSLNIPESKDGLPDVVSEALWNLECYRRMQTPDGGIRGGIESEEHPRHGECSWQESLRVFAYAPCVWSSYIYAGVAARASLTLEKLRPALAATYRTSALRAMEWAERELPGRASKNDPHAVRDARNLAAAELYRLTGDRKWHDIFRQTTSLNRPDADLFVWQQHEQRDAAWVYVRTTHPDVDKRLQENCRRAILKEADERVAHGARTGFRWTTFRYKPFMWGSLSAPDGVSLARAHRLTGDIKYLRALLQACLAGAGANASNLCYTTGLGHRYPLHPLHLDSRLTHQPAPPGLTVGGPKNVRQDVDGWQQRIVAPYCYPPVERWPSAEAYFDVFWYPGMCEFTVHSPIAPNAYVWGYLAARK